MKVAVSRRNARAAKPVPHKFLIVLELSGRLFRAKPALPGAWHISAIGRAERTVSGRAGIHVTLHLGFWRRDRRRGWSLRGCCSGRARDRRRNQARWHDRRADRCIGRNRPNCHWCRRWTNCGWRMQSGFGVGHWRHRSRQPVEPQQYTAKGNHQHRAIDRKPHRFAPASDEFVSNSQRRH